MRSSILYGKECKTYTFLFTTHLLNTVHHISITLKTILARLLQLCQTCVSSDFLPLKRIVKPWPLSWPRGGSNLNAGNTLQNQY
jgi:hypothetical protein